MHYRQQEKVGGGIPAECDGRHKPTKHKESNHIDLLIHHYRGPPSPLGKVVGIVLT